MRVRELSSRRLSFLAAAITTYGTNLAVAVMSLANVVIVSRYLGPSGRGQVAFLTTVATLVAYLFNMGIQQTNANLGGTNPELRRSLATNSLVFSFVFGALGAAVVLTVIAIFPDVGADADPKLRALALASSSMVMLWTYLTTLLQANYGFVVTNIAWLLAPLTNLTVNGVLSISNRLSVESAVSTWVAGWTLAAIVLVLGVLRGEGFGRPDLGLARTSLRFGLKAHAGRIMLVGNYRTDQWFVGAISGARELGLYSVAVAWSELLFFLPTALASVQRPDLVRAEGEEARRLAGAVFRLTMLVSTLITVGLVLGARFLCVNVFGPKFAGSVDDLRYLALGGFGVVALKLLGNALTAQRRPMRETAAIGVGFVASIALDIALIPHYGGAGAAIASTLSYSLGGVAVVIMFVRTLGGEVGDLLPRRDDAAAIRRQVRLLRGRARGSGAEGSL